MEKYIEEVGKTKYTGEELKVFYKGAEFVYNNISPTMAKTLLFSIDIIDRELLETAENVTNEIYWKRICDKYTEIINVGKR